MYINRVYDSLKHLQVSASLCCVPVPIVLTTDEEVLTMVEVRRIEEDILFFNDSEYDFEDVIPGCVHDFQKGEFMDVINSKECEDIFVDVLSVSHDEPLEDLLIKGAQLFLDTRGSNPIEALRLLCCGASALSAWLQHVECGPPLPHNRDGAPAFVVWLEALRGGDARRQAEEALARPARGDAHGDVPLAEALLMARAVFKALSRCEAMPTGAWWWARCLAAHQRALVEPCPSLHAELTPLLEAGPPPLIYQKSPEEAQAQLLLEAAQIYLHYLQVGPARRAAHRARDTLGLVLRSVGVLGKRTRFQHKDLPQLTIRVDLDEKYVCPPNHSVPEGLPKDVRLQDEVRLEKMAISKEENVRPLPSLSPVQQAVVLNCYALEQRSQPCDELLTEELEPYLQLVLAQPQTWSVQTSALLLRSKLEGKQRRTAERAMCQLEELVNTTNAEGPDVRSRLQLLLSVPWAERKRVRTELAHALARLNCVQSALDLFLELGQWEDAVSCYQVLGLRHKAAELLRRELAVRETVPLLCLLGDATGEPEHYERAWELSGQRSARAQRHWALHLFSLKQYAESIRHLQLSLECNSLQPDLWRRLGYAALDAQDWPLCATAYRRCVELDSENVEAWNNLAKTYSHQGLESRAWAALQEALKHNYEDWRLWMNATTLAADAGCWDEVVKALNRLVDLGHARVAVAGDCDALRRVADALESSGDTSLGARYLYFLGRLTAQITDVPEVWQVYARVTTAQPLQSVQSRERAAMQLQRAHRVATQRYGWTQQRDLCQRTLHLTLKLADAYLICAKSVPEPLKLLSSARLSIKGVLAAVKKETELANQLGSEVEDLEKKLSEVEEVIKALQETT